MAEPIMPSQISNIKMDLQGLMKYAESKGKQVIELSDDEKAMFIKEKDDWWKNSKTYTHKKYFWIYYEKMIFFSVIFFEIWHTNSKSKYILLYKFLLIQVDNKYIAKTSTTWFIIYINKL